MEEHRRRGAAGVAPPLDEGWRVDNSPDVVVAGERAKCPEAESRAYLLEMSAFRPVIFGAPTGFRREWRRGSWRKRKLQERATNGHGHVCGRTA